MELILIPGFWLDGSSWDEVTPALEAAGHHVQALTLPGLESAEADRSDIGLTDHVDAVVDAVDAVDEPVVLVGHSGGGSIAHAVADARPDRVARVVFVDAGPQGTGQAINDQLPIVDDEIPLPAWSLFDDEELVDLDDRRRDAFRARSLPEPVGVAYDRFALTDDRRYEVPATIVCCALQSAQLREWIAQDSPYVAELAAMRDVTYVDLPTGHWPQLTKPKELAQAILGALDSE
jgi:pimeloyl-ACP methyl ester carboxylesterase